MAAYTTIDDPEAYFQVQLYTGNGAANHAITLGADTDLQPDLVWIKQRSAVARTHCVFDAVRGATKLISLDSTAIESTDTDTLDSFTSDGFQVDADVKVNADADTYFALCWKANGTGASNTAGSINTGATSANTTSGFSIITYTGNGTAGATLGHGLGAVPHFIICKNTSGSADNGVVYHQGNTSAPETEVLYIGTTDGTSDNVGPWNDVAPSSTLITMGTLGQVNTDAQTAVMYAWTEIQGFSAMGSFTGNGNANGTFIYTGFRPTFVIFKKTSGTEQWSMRDTKRNPFNSTTTYISNADSTEYEDSHVDYATDFLSNGIKLRGTAGSANASGSTYIYMAWAEAPFVNSNGVPCNAR
jgi:hypothetical protein